MTRWYDRLILLHISIKWCLIRNKSVFLNLLLFTLILVQLPTPYRAGGGGEFCFHSPNNGLSIPKQSDEVFRTFMTFSPTLTRQ